MLPWVLSSVGVNCGEDVPAIGVETKEPLPFRKFEEADIFFAEHLRRDGYRLIHVLAGKLPAARIRPHVFDFFESEPSREDSLGLSLVLKDRHDLRGLAVNSLVIQQPRVQIR